MLIYNQKSEFKSPSIGFKKTIIININGVIFHIEEEAYLFLQQYMIDVKRHFGNTADSNEIVDDIENRIAEMFTERLNEQKAVINMHDVKEVCAQMGNVEDFDVDDGDNLAQEPFVSYDEERSFFRDPDDKVLGGVCSGLGHYLDFEAKWIRLAFLIIFLFAGTGFLVYIVLWIAIPKAKTRSDRMRMRGQSPTIENFKRNFKEEMGDVKRNFSEAGERMKTSLNNTNNKSSLKNLIKRTAVAFIKILGSLIIIMLSLSLASIIVAFFFGNRIAWTTDAFELGLPLYAIDPDYRTILTISLFIAVCIPILTLLFLTIRVVFDRKVMSTFLGFSMLIIWLIAVGISSYYIINTAIDFREEVAVVQERPLLAEPVYLLNLKDTRLKQRHDLNSGIKKTLKHRKKSAIWGSRIYLYIQKAEAGQGPKVIENMSAKGKTFDLAAQRAESINYQTEQNGSTLLFNNQPLLSNEELYRGQEVTIKLVLPVGTRIVISDELRKAIYIRGIHSFWDCEASYKSQGIVLETEWIMTDNGLKCYNDVETTIPPTDSNPIDSLENAGVD